MTKTEEEEQEGQPSEIPVPTEDRMPGDNNARAPMRLSEMEWEGLSDDLVDKMADADHRILEFISGYKS
jgi:hypothetical protein